MPIRSGAIEFPRKPVRKQKLHRGAYLCSHAPEHNPGRNDMTTMINEVDAPAGEIDGSSAGRFSFDSDRRVQTQADEPRPTANLPLDQTFPRLLYELAVRLPALREIQPVCVGSMNRCGTRYGRTC